jgi:hypothetical protein
LQPLQQNFFILLPPFSPPYGRYSFIARSQALERYFLEGRCWEDAMEARILAGPVLQQIAQR